MKKEIIISGFGGQGVLSMGKILAYSGLMEDKEVNKTQLQLQQRFTQQPQQRKVANQPLVPQKSVQMTFLM